MFGLNVKKSFLLFFGVAFFLSVSNLHATTLSPETFTLNGMYYSPVKDVYDANYPTNDNLISYFGTNNLLLENPYHATYTAGIFAGNDTGNLKPVNNIGELNDGLLNGQGNFFPGGAFIGDPYEGNTLQDVDGDGEIDDPGWIMLGEFEVGEDPDYQNLGGDDGVDIGTLLQMTFDFDIEWTTGNWVLWTDPAKMAEVYARLGFAAFDNLAFVIKSGNDNSEGGWAVYDFNFNSIFRLESESGNTQLDFETAYTLWGDFDDVDFTTNDGQRDISHFSVWVRDPDLNSPQIPEPATILLFGFGLLGVAHIGRRKK